MLFTSHKENFRYYLLAILIGTSSGLAGSIFRLTVEQLSCWPSVIAQYIHTRSNVILDISKYFTADTALLLAGFLYSALLILLSKIMVRTICPEAAGSGVQEIEGALIERRPLRWKRVLFVKFFGGLLSLSSGLVLGREGPTIHIGAAIANGFSNLVVCPPIEKRGLLAAGAAAGLASAFNAPLAAVLFVIEETHQQFPYTLKTYMGVILAAVTGAFVTQDMAGIGPFMKLIELPSIPLRYFFLFIILGIIVGAFGVIFNQMLIRGLDLSDRISKIISPYILPCLVGGIAGILVFKFPDATGDGKNLILELARSHHGFLIETLGVLFLLRWMMILTSYVTGVPGGIFAPILTLATCFGFFFSSIFDLIIPLSSSLQISLAVASMGGLFTGSIRAPIVGAIVVLELTDSYNIMLPVIMTCCIANITAEHLGGAPLYEQLLERTLKLSGASHVALASAKHSQPF